ncbi:RsiV family protein [Moraxella oblonga]|uniref:RsiV family protein n=1 Tax=Moraxella oblonga TaxID=200413 RepID=UPI00146FF06B|nr:RsiV family protein [Moraxella oblonga]
MTMLTTVLSITMMLIACNENTSSLSNNPTPSTQQTTSNTDAKVKFSTVPFKYELPQAMKDACDFDKNKNEEYSPCTQIEVELVKIEPAWIEQIVNKAITNDDGSKLIKFKKTIDEFVNENLEFINEMKEIAKENGEEAISGMGYVWHTKPEMLPTFNHLTQIAIYNDMYMGGAHGVQDVNYLIFDMDLQSQIQLHDVIRNEKTSEFHELYHRAFKDYLAKELEITTEEDIQEYEDMWSFKLAENFYFNKEGLVLVYSPYEMGAYAQGFIELTVPYDKLTPILKESYLPKS